MTELMLFLCKPFVFMGPAEFRGSFGFACIRNLVRLIFLFGVSYLLTCGLVSWAIFQPPTRDAVTERFADVERKLRDPAFSEGMMKTAGIDTKTLSFEILPTQPNDDKSYDIAISYDGDRTDIGSVRKVAMNSKPDERWWLIASLNRWGLWPFREQVFVATPFVASTLLMSSEAAAQLSMQERQTAKAKLDRILALAPSAKSADFAWPRRLSGPIQFGCYFLFFLGSLLLILHWAANVVPNLILRSAETLSIRRLQRVVTEQPKLLSGAAPSTELPADEVEVVIGEGRAPAAAVENSVLVAPVTVEEPGAKATAQTIAYETVNVTTPWSGRAEGDLDRMITTLDEIRTSARDRAGLLEARPIFPLLDIRITGLKAMKTARSGENVPSFVAVETDAAGERLEAQHRFSAFCIWAIPTLGFIGTVIGIGDALLSTVDLQSAYEVTRITAESSIGLSIGVAFDTTFVALVLSFFLMLLLHFVQDAEDKMLAREKRSALQDLLQVENLRPGNDVQEFAQSLAAWGLSVAQIVKWFEALSVDRRALEMAMNNFSNENLRMPPRPASATPSLLRAALVAGIAIMIALNWDRVVGLVGG